MLVVVCDVVDDEAFELLAVPDDGSVEEFSSDGSDPAFGERVGHRRSHGCLEHLHALGLEDLVEAVDELAAAIADQSPSTAELVGVGEEQVACGSCGPGSGWIGGDTGEEHLTGLLMKNRT